MDLRVGRDRIIEQSYNMKLLGVNTDCELNFSTHISEVSRKTSQQIGVLGRLRNLILTHAKLHLHKVAILSHLTYCSMTFCRAPDKRKVERLRERALRTVCNSKTDSYKNLLKRAHLSTLHDRMLQEIAIMMFKAKNNLLPRNVLDFFYNTGGGKKRLNTEELGLHLASF